MNAASPDQIRLLDVQGLDVRLQQLAHKRKSLPAHAEIESLSKDLSQLRALLVAAQTEESDCAREQTKAEQDVDQVRASLAKRQGDLEDVVLEVMERRESAQERVTELTGRVASVQAKIDDATARRDAALEEIDGEVASVTKEREVIAAAVPADLLKLYEKLREQHGGIGAAKLYQRTCQGCRQELAITELNEVRAAAPDTVVRCENCRRILVRTAESGL
ncbi:zinc ribbon domain-containing protein [Streptomyces triticisoli]|uniref:zinc ribbon domain-containing protein n=1 Tax=Streptomyces triticisoli TaxID=2182797 RepID=UPI000DD64318|nr:C4-type zinc ribbon domain-containing protein [Streptomyces triticisoli]